MKKEFIFFIDQEQFKTEATHLTVRELLVDFAQCDPNETTLALRHGNEIKKLVDLGETIALQNGMKFVVYHNTPTTVS